MEKNFRSIEFLIQSILQILSNKSCLNHLLRRLHVSQANALFADFAGCKRGQCGDRLGHLATQRSDVE
jgi:hypothetical protein